MSKRRQVFRQRRILITPDIAAQWLDKCNTANYRALSRQKVLLYTRLMKEGKWIEDSHNAIAFDTDGILADGQHRLCAIKESGISIQMVVIRGVDPRTKIIVDAQKQRRPHDAVRNAGFKNASKMAVAIANLIHRMNCGKYAPSPQDYIDFYAKMERHVKFAIDLREGFGKKEGRTAFWAAIAAANYCGIEEAALYAIADIFGTGEYRSRKKGEKSVAKFRDWYIGTRHNPGNRPTPEMEYFYTEMLIDGFIKGKDAWSPLKSHKKRSTGEYVSAREKLDEIYKRGPLYPVHKKDLPNYTSNGTDINSKSSNKAKKK